MIDNRRPTADATSRSGSRDVSDRGALRLRVVLAYDLSSGADRAVGLIAATSWPPATVVRVVTSPMGVGLALSSFASPREVRAHARQLRRSIAAAQTRVAAELARGGFDVRSAILAGQPANTIVNDADRFGADLIIAGARDQGPMAATPLGSVSSEIAESARCSVLIARGTSAARVLLATDGSTQATLAARLVAEWPLFASGRIRVLGVGDVPPRYAGVMLSSDELRAADGESLLAWTAPAGIAVKQAVEQLAARHRQVEAEIRTGDPAAEIAAAGREWSADLVVIGSGGEPLLRRLLLGSVARKVLHGVRSSVLVVRPDGREDSDSANAKSGSGRGSKQDRDPGD